MTIKIEIAHRKLYRIALFKMLKPIFELLPSSYSVKTNNKGTFFFWAYPFDIVHITVDDSSFRTTYTLRHRVKNFWPKYRNIYHSLVMLIFPKLSHQ